MRKVKFVGDREHLLPTLNRVVNNGDVIDVPDDFNNALFEDVVDAAAVKAATPPSPKESVKS